MNILSLINPSLEIVYRSTTLSSHGIIRLIRFVFNSYLILLINVTSFDVG
jgi:hypothetical protein